MDSRKLVNEIAAHQVVRSEMSMEMQLGFPYLEKKRGKLCIKFFPHRESMADGEILYYSRQYELELVYPFRHVVTFKNLAFEEEIDTKAPIARIEVSWLASKGMYIINELYDACDRVLAFQEKDKQVSDIMVANYQKAFARAVERMGLAGLYV